MLFYVDDLFLMHTVGQQLTLWKPYISGIEDVCS